MITENIKNSIEESILCWLATVDENGAPNCSPKEAFTHFGNNEIIIANIASPESVKNIKLNPRVCVSFVHIFKQRGFKVKGKARYLEPGDLEYPQYKESLDKIICDAFPIKGIICIEVKSSSEIIAPSYYMVPGTTEESQIKQAKVAYGIDKSI